MGTLLVIVEAIAIIVLVSLGLFPAFRGRDGGLTRGAKVLFVVVAVILISAMGRKQILDDRAAQESRKLIEELHDSWFEQISALVMTTPKGPELALPTPASESIRIVWPKDGSTVEMRNLIRGEVLDPASRVWVVVHPMDTSSYWVQPAVSVRRTGDWSVTAYFGRSGPIDVGKTFEVLAVVDPQMELQEGQFFDKWPDARLASSAIVVERK